MAFKWCTLLVVCQLAQLVLGGNSTDSYIEIPFGDEYHTQDTQVLMQNLTKTLNKTLQNYDKNLRPSFFGPPVKVIVSFHIEGIPRVSEVDMEIQVDFYLRQQWKDDRLKFDVATPIKYIPLTYEFGQKIWFPDTFFQNEKDSFVHSATVSNAFFRWFPDGRILQSIRMTLTIACPMNLQNFPLDYQICSIYAASYGLPDNDVTYDWETEKSSIHFGPHSLELLQSFNLAAYRQRKTSAEFKTGNYTTLVCDFLLYRTISYYLIEVYIPSALVVVISWFAFWMGRDASTERMSLGVTSVLTITTLLLSTHSSSPKISYIKAIDIYVGVCFIMVFISLLQSAVVGYMLKQARKSDEQAARENLQNGPRSHESISNSTSAATSSTDGAGVSIVYEMKIIGKKTNEKIKRDAERKITTCDIASRLAFPLIFALFNAVYWTTYLIESRMEVTHDWSTDTKAYHKMSW